MSSGRALSRRRGAALLASAALVSVVVSAPIQASPAYAAPAYTLEERAQAIAEPAVIYTEFIAQGVIRDKRSGQPIPEGAVKVSIPCSAVVIDPAGTAVTTRFCVAPAADRLARLAYFTYTGRQIEAGKLSPSDQNSAIDQMAANDDFTSDGGPGEPQRHLVAQTGNATQGFDAAPAIEVEAPEANSDDEGFVAIKIPAKDLPAIELGDSTTAFTPGSSAIAIGYTVTAGSSGSNRSFAVAAAPVKITGTEGTHEPPTFTFAPKTPSLETRGGPLVDENGRMIGQLLWNDTANDGVALAATLAKLGVKNELRQTDKLYRDALDDYFAGRYRDAIKKFNLVTAVQSTNHVAARYRDLATSRLAIEGDNTPGVPMVLIIVLTTIGGILIGTVITVILLRRRVRANQPHAEQLVPISVNPVSVNPFAPTSGAGGYPGSADFSQYPTAHYPTVDPTSPVGVEPPPTVLSIPEAAPAGVPVPHPPVKRPPAEPEPLVAEHRNDPPTVLAAEQPAPQPSNGVFQQFAWPQDDEGPTQPADNPWAPPPGR